MDTKTDKAIEFLTEFFDEMYNWERKAYELLNPEDLSSLDSAAESLRDIYSRYLTKKDRKTGESAGPSVGASPRYNKQLERVVSVEADVEKGRVVITTEKQFENTPDFKETNRYTLVARKNGFLIDKREIFSAFRKKWVNIVF